MHRAEIFAHLGTMLSGVSGRARTYDPQLRRLLLYPAELRRH